MNKKLLVSLLTMGMLVGCSVNTSSTVKNSSENPTTSSSKIESSKVSSETTDSSSVNSESSKESTTVHEHTYSTEWEKDDTHHWHAAVCDHAEEVADKAAHTWNAGTVTKEATEEDLDVKISYNKGDIVIPANQERKVGKGEDIKPGKYIILSTVEGTDTINIRIGGYVRVYAHASEIILAEGETVCPTNIAVILR
jgi:hypothetical protein